MFRSQRPGYLPWLLDVEEAEFLMTAVQQILEVAPRLTRDRAALGPDTQGRILCRTRYKEKWQDEWVLPPTSTPLVIEAPPPLDDLLVARLKQHASTIQRGGAWQIEYGVGGAVVAENGKRPFSTVLLLMADEQSGFILGFEILTPGAHAEAAMGFLVQQLLRSPIFPTQFQVARDDVQTWITPIAQVVGIPVERKTVLRAARQALQDFARRFG
jgi:hypothetical protein